jgi:ribonuclease BN (tRNA processing enzyme)
MTNHFLRAVCFLLMAAQFSPAQSAQILFLGTGTPRPQPDHQGQSIAIIVNRQPYLFDSGPGISRQASAALLKMENLTIAFLTHLHTDHTLGLPDLIFTPWIMGRTVPLELYGPIGT